MKKIVSKIGLMALLASCLNSAQAVPQSFDFTASGFLSTSATLFGGNGNSVPNSSLSGTVTIDGSTVTAINLTIGSHTYTASEVGTDGTTIVGGNLAGPNGMGWGTDDFWLIADFQALQFLSFTYTVAGVSDDFHTRTGTLSVHQDGSIVPEPASLALAGLGLAGLGWTRRRKALKAAA